jgi:hypothetical protein
MFSGLSALVVEGVADEGDLVRVVTRTRDDPVPCPARGRPTGRVHGFHERTVTTVRACDLPHLHAFVNGLELDRAAVNAGLTLPHHNGRTEGVNTRIKRIMRQMHGRAGFALLHHRILLQ